MAEDMDECYYCHKPFPADKVYAHEGACPDNPNK